MEQRNKRGLARTPRTNDTIVEYFEKFGQNRDLEKFMRIYSPASSQDSQSRHGCEERRTHLHTRGSHETISSTSSCEALAKMHSRPLSNICCGANSKSMPNIIDVHEKEHHLKDVCVDINIEIEEDKVRCNVWI